MSIMGTFRGTLTVSAETGAFQVTARSDHKPVELIVWAPHDGRVIAVSPRVAGLREADSVDDSHPQPLCGTTDASDDTVPSFEELMRHLEAQVTEPSSPTSGSRRSRSTPRKGRKSRAETQ